MADFSRQSGTGWDQGDPANTFARQSGTGWIQQLGLGVDGSSDGTFTLGGSATGNIPFLLAGASDATFTLSGNASGEINTLLEGASDGTFTLGGSATGNLDPGSWIGASDVLFELVGLSSGIITPPPPPPPGALPPGWVIAATLEQVPDPNGIAAPFTRWTYICTDENGQYVCASGAEEDCQAQALSMAQSRTQRQPYNEAI